MAGTPRAHSPVSPPSPETFELSPNVAMTVEEAEGPSQESIASMKKEMKIKKKIEKRKNNNTYVYVKKTYLRKNNGNDLQVVTVDRSNKMRNL